ASAEQPNRHRAEADREQVARYPEEREEPETDGEAARPHQRPRAQLQRRDAPEQEEREREDQDPGDLPAARRATRVSFHDPALRDRHVGYKPTQTYVSCQLNIWYFCQVPVEES